jgi:signal transduction histidine kinase
MKLFYGSIRKKLVVLVLLATTPVFLVLLGTELVNRQDAIKAAKKDTAIFLNGFAEVQRRITDSTRTLLRTVASMPEIRNANVERSRVILSTLLEANPIYTNVILVDLKGNVVAAGKKHDRARQLNFSDRKQFKMAIASKGFASGEFVMGKSTNKAIFPFGMAVLDEQGTPKGAIIIGVSLSHYGSLFERGAYPKNTFFGLCDHNGMRLFRYPLSEKIAIGKPIKNKVFQAARTKGGPGSIMALASDGMKRIIVFEPLSFGDDEPPYMYMFIGSDYEQIQERAHAILNRLATTSFLSLTLALVIAWFIGGRSIARRVEKLTLMTKKFSQGEKNVTSGIDYSNDEVGDLAQSFDNMILMLHQHEEERKKAEEKLIKYKVHLEDLVEERTEDLSFTNKELQDEINERQRIEKELKNTLQALESSNKELDDFAYIASHDLKEPLRGINNYSTFLMEDYGNKLDEEGVRKLETLVSLTTRLKNLIDDLLSYSKVGRTELSYHETSLNDVLLDVLETLRIGIAEKDIEIRVPEALPTMQCDTVRIKEVFRNLISNAIKYNDKTNPWIEIGFSDNTFFVRDNGIGIREKHYKDVFKIFKSLHSRNKYGGGTGAGMTIVYKIIDKHNGKIWIESEYGEGTTFYFTLGGI